MISLIILNASYSYSSMVKDKEINWFEENIFFDFFLFWPIHVPHASCACASGQQEYKQQDENNPDSLDIHLFSTPFLSSNNC